MKPVPVPFGAP